MVTQVFARGSLSTSIPPAITACMHSYSSDIAGVVVIRDVRGGSSLRTRRGSTGVNNANSLISFIKVQLFVLYVRRSKHSGAKRRKGTRSSSFLHARAISSMTLTVAPTTDGSSSSSFSANLSTIVSCETGKAAPEGDVDHNDPRTSTAALRTCGRE